MGLLIDGRWSEEWYQPDAAGRFVRPETRFRNWITDDGSSEFAPETGRYHLYIAYACPWAHRTLIMRRLKGLEKVVTLSVVDPEMAEGGWRFSDAPGCIPDSINQARYLSEIYTRAEPAYTGRVTVPVLWDKKNDTIVNNESREIMRLFDTRFGALAENPADYYPGPLRVEIDRTIDAIYEPVNNGVYRSGFATTQKAYDEAVTELFEALDYWEGILADRRYLCGNQITEADWCLFTTLLRFDLVYYVHFKCNLRHIWDYPNLWGYLKELYQLEGIVGTCNFDHIKRHYYSSHETINPSRIVPIGPVIDLNSPHDRARLGTASNKETG